jgi:hypothetical protein
VLWSRSSGRNVVIHSGLDGTKTELPAAFYEPIEELRFRPTEATMSPWDERMQHGGPPTALAVHVLNRALPRAEMRMARIAIDFLGAIPLDDMEASVEVVRPGRRIELTRTTLSARGVACVAASVWRIAARDDVAVPDAVARRDRENPLPALPGPEAAAKDIGTWAYGRAIEWRFVRGDFYSAGPSQVWSRSRIPLVAGRELDGVERLALVADSANGISRELDWARYLFVPPGITITLDRHPQSEWTFLSATTHVGPEGLGFTECALGDARGVLGLASQPLYLEPRSR